MVKNANRSGGPKTIAGKLAASRNAIKSGAYANITVLPGEDMKQFEELEEQFFKDFAPADLAESAMVRELTSLTWKKLRLERLEHQALIHLMATEPSFADVNRQLHGAVRSSAAWAFRQIDRAGPGWIKHAQALNKAADEMKAVDRSALDLATLERKFPQFYSVLTRLAEANGIANLATFIVNGKVMTADLRSIPFWDHVIETAAAEAGDIRWVAENKDNLLTAIQHVKDQRLMTFMLGDRVRRVHEDLNRAFFKILSELRKYQVWRHQRPIDVTPTESAPAAR